MERGERNVLGGPLESCSRQPLTGFTRKGVCETPDEDVGLHAVCALMTAEFLAFSRARGNDLTTPHPEFRWCVCAARWREALEAGVAPPVLLRATAESALTVVPLDDLMRLAVDVQ
jgi:hypothetical protein